MDATAGGGGGGGGCSVAASSSAAGSSGGGGEEEELVDTTEFHQEAKRQRLLEEATDLCGDESAEMPPVRVNENTAPQGRVGVGPVKVKAERA